VDDLGEIMQQDEISHKVLGYSGGDEVKEELLGTINSVGQ